MKQRVIFLLLKLLLKQACPMFFYRVLFPAAANAAREALDPPALGAPAQREQRQPARTEAPRAPLQRRLNIRRQRNDTRGRRRRRDGELLIAARLVGSGSDMLLGPCSTDPFTSVFLLTSMQNGGDSSFSLM